MQAMPTKKNKHFASPYRQLSFKLAHQERHMLGLRVRVKQILRLTLITVSAMATTIIIYVIVIYLEKKKCP
jgi:hypothetical protein